MRSSPQPSGGEPSIEVLRPEEQDIIRQLHHFDDDYLAALAEALRKRRQTHPELLRQPVLRLCR